MLGHEHRCILCSFSQAGCCLHQWQCGVEGKNVHVSQTVAQKTFKSYICHFCFWIACIYNHVLCRWVTMEAKPQAAVCLLFTLLFYSEWVLICLSRNATWTISNPHVSSKELVWQYPETMKGIFCFLCFLCISADELLGSLKQCGQGSAPFDVYFYAKAPSFTAHYSHFEFLILNLGAVLSFFFSNIRSRMLLILFHSDCFREFYVSICWNWLHLGGYWSSLVSEGQEYMLVLAEARVWHSIMFNPSSPVHSHSSWITSSARYRYPSLTRSRPAAPTPSVHQVAAYILPGSRVFTCCTSV